MFAFVLDLSNVPHWTQKIGLEARERLERRIDRDFNKGHRDNETDLNSRWRINLSSSDGANRSLDLTYQYFQLKSWVASASKPDNIKRSDVLVARLRGPVANGQASIGRQQIRKGSGRLLGESDWGQTGQAFDSVRWQSGRFDFFAGKLGLAATPNHTSRLAFASYTGTLGDTTIYYGHNTPSNPSSDIWTLHQFAHHNLGTTSADLEGAVQWGKIGDNDLSAWAGTLRFSRKLSPVTNAQLDLNAASGGSDSKNPKTFDQLFPSNHGRYGEMDMQGYRNAKGFSLTITNSARKNLTLGFGAHHYWLFDKKDAWYAANSRANRGAKGKYVDPTGKSGGDIGSEFDFFAEAKTSASLTLRAGISTFLPGGFVKSFNDGSRANQSWGYVQATAKF